MVERESRVFHGVGDGHGLEITPVMHGRGRAVDKGIIGGYEGGDGISGAKE